MKRRQDNIRAWMASAKVDACLFTSYHNINYLSDFFYCYFGRKYGLVIAHGGATSVTAAIDGGQPARRTFGDINAGEGLRPLSRKHRRLMLRVRTNACGDETAWAGA